MMLDKLNIKRSHLWLLGSILAGAVLTLGSGISYAQRRPPGTAVLSEMPQQQIDGRYRSENRDISVGREIFQTFARLANRWGDSNLGYAEVAFRLAASNQASQYRRLTLAFGVSDANDSARRGAVTRLSVYRDGEFYGYKDISLGDQHLWVIDVANTRSIVLEASCTRANSSGTCASIYFFEELLEP